MRTRILASLSSILLLLGLASWMLVPTVDDEREHEDCAWCKLITTDDPLRFAASEGIGWYGTWEGAVAESERSDRPIMLHFASPRCENVPGVW